MGPGVALGLGLWCLGVAAGSLGAAVRFFPPGRYSLGCVLMLGFCTRGYLPGPQKPKSTSNDSPKPPNVAQKIILTHTVGTFGPYAYCRLVGACFLSTWLHILHIPIQAPTVLDP